MANQPKRLEQRESIFNIREIRFSEAPWYDTTTARFLGISDEFYEDVESARTELDVKTVDYYKYNPDITKLPTVVERVTNPDIETPATEDGITPVHLALLRYKEAYNKLEQLDESSDKIIKKYRLAPRWQFPVEILILTDTLIMPIHSPIYSYLNLSGFYLRQPTTVDLLDLPLINDNNGSKKPYSDQASLTIVVNEQMTMNELVQHISENEEIKHSLQQLPKFSRSDVKDETMHWGHLVWAYFTFHQIESVTEAADKLVSLASEDEEMEVPSSKRLRLYYKRYLKAQQQLGL